jgi:hypothetical protein
MLAILNSSASSSVLTGYANVSYETFVPSYIEIGSAIEGFNFTIPSDTLISPIPPWEMNNPVDGLWYSTIFDRQNFKFGGPFNNQARRTIPDSWNPSGNIGSLSLAQWASLQADVVAGTKRNLVGTPVFS